MAVMIINKDNKDKPPGDEFFVVGGHYLNASGPQKNIFPFLSLQSVLHRFKV
jgi:hypothetical protein